MTTDKACRAEELLTGIAAKLPLVDATELGVLAEIQSKLERLAADKTPPKALRGMAARAAKLATHIIMAETPFDTGMKKLGEAVAAMLRAVEQRSAVETPDETRGAATPEPCASEGGDTGEAAAADDATESAASPAAVNTPAAADTAPPSPPQDQDPEPGRRIDADPALLADFITEAHDHIHTAETGLLELENDPANAESLNTVFRACHTIKGVSGFLGLKEINKLSHSIENVMDQARRGELALQPGHIDLLLESFDCLKALVASLEQSMAGAAYEIPAVYASIMERLANPVAVSPVEIPSVPEGARLGDILVQKGAVSEQEISAAAQAQESGDHRKLGEILIEKGAASPRDVAAALAGQAASRQSSRHIEETVRVPVERLDQLVDAIGEAVIAQSMLIADPAIAAMRNSALEKKAANAALIMRKVQELSMSLRMVSIRSTFQKMARLVRDLAKKSGKEVDFFTEGEDTELDKSVVENIGDPLIHMLRNAIDHGIEDSVDERVRLGKPARARVSLRAFHRAGNIYVEVSDDGRGLDREAILAKAIKQGLCAEADKLSDQDIYQFIFRPGFSTAKKVTDVSGRGVGMDVVRKNIQALRGSVEIHTEKGKGSTFSIRLPLTLAIIDGMIVKVGGETYILPTLSIVESIRPQPGQVETILNKGEILRVRESHVRLVRAGSLLNRHESKTDATEGIAIIAEDMLGRRIALLVDEIVGQQQVVIKNIGLSLIHI